MDNWITVADVTGSNLWIHACVTKRNGGVRSRNLRKSVFVWSSLMKEWGCPICRRRKGLYNTCTPAKCHVISVSLQKSCMVSTSHGNVTKSHGI